MDDKNKLLLPEETIMSRIYLIRGQKVMLDMDLAELYDVETKYLKRSVRRNNLRFPDDFMFELTTKEFENLKCKIGTSSWGGTRYLPMAFTEMGVAMLSSILNSKRAILVNIQIMRIFTRLRQLLQNQNEILEKLKKLEDALFDHDDKIIIIFEYLKKLEQSKSAEITIKERRRIGFKIED